MPHTAAEQAVDIVYNLTEAATGLYLPLAFICSRDAGGLLAHVQQQATAETIGAFQLELTATRQRTFELVAELQAEAIELYFKPKKTRSKKVPPLHELVALTNKEQRATVLRYVHRRLDELLRICTRENYPLSLDLQRRVLVKEYVIRDEGAFLSPLLSFVKEPSGVRYQLKLRQNEDSIVPLRGRKVLALTNHPAPAWLLIDQELFRIEHLNGYVVKPFLTKDEVVIPAAQANRYFRNFIAKVVSKVEIEAEGFAVEQRNELQACQLELVQHPLEDRYYLYPRMDYGEASFGWNEQRSDRTLLNMESEEVSITQIRRDPTTEKKLMERLKSFDLQPVSGTQYFHPSTEASTSEPYAALAWLLRQREALQAAGFVVMAPEVGEQAIYPHPAKLTLGVSEDNDWFDLRGEISVGEYKIPFSKLIKYIRKGERLYPLPNGNHFLIPIEWLTQYGELSQFVKLEQEQVRLARSHYTLLDEFDLESADPEAAQELAQAYRPSPLLKAALRPYQLEGVQWLVQHYHQGLGACLADDMGLGKTLQTIAVLLFAKEQLEQQEQAKPTKEAGPGAATPQLDLFAAPDEDFLQPLKALIVLPASLVYNWAAELERFAPSLTVLRHTGQQRQKDARVLRRFDIILTTYQTANRDQELLRELELSYIILDESQQIKNRQSKVFKALNSLNASHRISLSGTPIENSLSDLWSQMQFINPGLLRSYNFFRQEFILPIERQDNEEKKAQLRKLVQPYLLRRTKDEVAKDLPELQVQPYICDMTSEQRKRYEKEKSAARNHLLSSYKPADGQYRMLVVRTLTRLRQLANHPALISADYAKGSGKFTEVLEEWEQVRKSGHKALFFSSFVTHLELFKKVFDEADHPYAWISGKVSSKARAEEVRRFQEEEDVQAFFISIKSGGTGLNLTAADYVFVLDPWWNPTTEQQAIARAHRIGRKDRVIARKFISKDTIEEKILKLQQKKTQLAEDIIGKSGKLLLDKQELSYLLK
ncbi:MAG: DEAD/DEAH box helicase [Bacteroidota bacterium]